MKNPTHFLRFNNDIPFRLNPATKHYSLQAGNYMLTMPYVLTLRLKRYLKGNLSPTPQQLTEWYENLPRGEKSLVQYQPILTESEF